jgi:hypothetical protein
VEYLSDEWLAALDSAARAVTVDPPATGTIVVQTVVTDPAGRAVTYHLTLDDCAIGVQPGTSEAPTVTFTQSRETAAAVASGRRSAQEAFMAGDIRVGGDVTALIEQRDALRAFDEVMAGVLGDTEFPTEH